MEKNKNKKLLIIVGLLLLLVGSISFAYFIAIPLFNGDGAKGVLTTANIDGSIINVEGTLNFNDLDIMPGHKNVSSLKLTATGENELIPYNLIWEGTNSLNTPLEFTVYKTNSSVDVNATCQDKVKVVNGAQHLNEECTISNLDSLGNPVGTGTISKNNETTKVTLATDEFITATTEGSIVYYYVILEYPNLSENQNQDIGGNFSGKVTVEKNDATPDVIVDATYLKQDDGSYAKSTITPEGYELNTEKSTCTNSATPKWTNNTLNISNLTTKGTTCTIYLDKIQAINTIIPDAKDKTEKVEFTGIATAADTGIYKAPDDYGTSYYFRGLEGSLNNWVNFAGSYWRIIRINGNGTVRMIYAGAASGNPSNANRTGTTTQINGATYMYNHTYNDNAYVGYMMGIPLNGDYPIQNETTIHSGSYVDAHSNVYDSDAKKIIDNWYKTNIVDKGYSDKIDINTGFCNNGQTASGISSGYSTARYNQFTTSYISWGSVYANGWKSIQTPTLQCTNKERDLFTLNNANIGNKKLIYPVGMITSDEAIFAGAFSDDRNKNYYLYTNQNYWTMSPWYYNNAATIGYINGGDVRAAAVAFSLCDLRPVINLRADTIFSGDGSEANPYKITE